MDDMYKEIKRILELFKGKLFPTFYLEIIGEKPFGFL